MLPEPYLEGYPRYLPQSKLAGPSGPIDISSSRQWSYRFGQVLHDFIAGREIRTGEYVEMLSGYSDWLQYDRPRITDKVNASEDKDAARSAANELNFHILNGGMLCSWLQLGDPEQKPKLNRTFEINLSQDAIAIHGLNYYLARESLAGPTSDYSYFSAENARARNSFEGRVAEFDAALVFLEVMRRRDEYIIFPAPLQFEKFSNVTKADEHGRQQQPNVDFVAVNRFTRNAIGAQVKSHVTSKMIDTIDSGRVVMIDASRDFGDERAMRVRSDNTTPRMVSWAGLLCAQHVEKMKIAGKGRSALQLNPQELHSLKVRAFKLTRNFTPHFTLATDRITERIDSRIAEPV